MEAMNALNRSVPVTLVLVVLAGSGPFLDSTPLATELRAQVPPVVGAELPAQGEVWFELVPTFESWSEQFALGSDSVSDGAREPLYSDHEGPLAERLYPGPGPLAADLNQGADSLGYAPLDPSDVSLGDLDFGSLTARRTSLPLRAMAGVTPRVALALGVEFVQTKSETTFRYDSAAASVAPASAALPEGSAYLEDLSSARETLESQLQGGELSSEQEAAAMALLEQSGAFAAVLQRRLEGAGLLPLAGSAAGDAMAGRASEIRTGFQDFEIEAPALGLSATSTRAALDELFTGPFLSAEALGSTDHGLQPVRFEAGLRVGVLDSYPDGATAADSAATEDPGLRLRTTVGFRAWWPMGEPDAAPFFTPSVFLDTPAGNGARLLEATLYQDLAYGPLELSAAVAFGKRLRDELTLRVRAPDRPFALAGTELVLERDPGDYVWLRASPRLAINSSLSLGGEYAYWNVGETTYRVSGAGSGGSEGDSADPLGLETAETRHDVGIGVYYTASGPAPGPGARPVEVAFTYRLAVAGSGGQTPSPNVIGVRLRVPVGLF